MNKIKSYRDKDGKFHVGLARSLCPFCGEPTEQPTGSPGEQEFDGNTFSSQPCQVCKLSMEAGILIAETKAGEEGKTNPIRTGRMVTITEEQFNDLFEMPDRDCRIRFYFLEEKMFEKIFGGAIGKGGRTK